MALQKGLKENEKVLLPFRWAGGKFYALKILEKFWKK